MHNSLLETVKHVFGMQLATREVTLGLSPFRTGEPLQGQGEAMGTPPPAAPIANTSTGSVLLHRLIQPATVVLQEPLVPSDQ